jgi:hypothetical protein
MVGKERLKKNKSNLTNKIVGKIERALSPFTLSARTRKIPKSSNIAHCVTILRCNTRRMAARRFELTERHHGNSKKKNTLTSRIVPVTDPDTLRATDRDESAAISGS